MDLDIPTEETSTGEDISFDRRPSQWQPHEYVEIAVDFLTCRFYDRKSTPIDSVKVSAGYYYPKKYVYDGLIRMMTLEGGNPLHEAKNKQFLIAALIADAADLPYKLKIIYDLARHVTHKLKSYGGLRKWLINRFMDHSLDLQSKHQIFDIFEFIGYPKQTLEDIPEYLTLLRVPLSFARLIAARFCTTKEGKELVESNSLLMFRLQCQCPTN